MTNAPDLEPIRMEVPEDFYEETLRLFKQDGAPFNEVIATNPRLAYEAFRVHYRDVLFGRTTTLVEITGDNQSTTDKEKDGEQAFEAIAKDAFSNIIPAAGEEEREVVISVMKNPSFLEVIRNKYKEPTLKLEVSFTIPALSRS